MKNETKRAITKRMAGRPLSELPFPEWAQHWPVINPDLTLTGETVDSDGCRNMANYRDMAMIDADAAREAGWNVEQDEDGYYGYAESPIG